MPGPDPQHGESKTTDLADVSAPRLLFALLSQRFTGTLRIKQPPPNAGVRIALFVGGMPISFDWIEEGTRLGEILVEQGALDETSLEKALESDPEEERRLGQNLTALKLVSGGKVRTALRAQCERRLEVLFGMRSGQVQLTIEPVDGDPDLGHAHTLALIARGIRYHFDAKRIEDEMGPLLEGPLQSGAALEKYRDRFEFLPDDAQVLDRLGDGITLSDLAEVSGVDPVRTIQIVYTLWACSMVAPTSDAISERSGVGLPTLEADLGDIETKVRLGVGPYDVLSLPDDADLRAIDAAFTALQKRFDPDTVPEEATDAIRSRVYQVRKLLVDVREAAREHRVVLAELQLDRLLKEQKYDRAQPLVEDLKTIRADDPKIVAAAAWCNFEISDGSEAAAKKALAALDAAAEANDGMADTHYFRGRLLRQLGSMKDALTAFDRARELDPKNLDAERQARVIRSGDAQKQSAKEAKSHEPAFVPKGSEKARHPLWRGFWPVLWIASGVLLLGMIAAQIVMRMDW